jgi:hypothetical protein
MDVGLECLLPFLVGDVADVLERGLVGRVVDENVDAAQIVNRLFDNLATMLCVLQVAGHQNRFPAFLLYEFLDLGRLVGLV